MIVIARHSLSSSDLTPEIYCREDYPVKLDNDIALYVIAVLRHGNLCFGNDRLLCVIPTLDMAINLGYKIHLN